jgi:hypothetical protein
MTRVSGQLSEIPTAPGTRGREERTGEAVASRLAPVTLTSATALPDKSPRSCDIGRHVTFDGSAATGRKVVTGHHSSRKTGCHLSPRLLLVATGCWREAPYDDAWRAHRD